MTSHCDSLLAVDVNCGLLWDIYARMDKDMSAVSKKKAKHDQHHADERPQKPAAEQKRDKQANANSKRQ